MQENPLFKALAARRTAMEKEFAEAHGRSLLARSRLLDPRGPLAAADFELYRKIRLSSHEDPGNVAVDHYAEKLDAAIGKGIGLVAVRGQLDEAGVAHLSSFFTRYHGIRRDLFLIRLQRVAEVAGVPVSETVKKRFAEAVRQGYVQ